MERSKKDIKKFEVEFVDLESNIAYLDIIKNEEAYNDAKAKVDGKKNGELKEELQNWKVRTEELIEFLNKLVKTAEALRVEGESKNKVIGWFKNEIGECTKRLNWFTKSIG